MTVYLKDGKVLLRNGQVATAPECCCGGSGGPICTIEEPCCQYYADFLYAGALVDNTGGGIEFDENDCPVRIYAQGTAQLNCPGGGSCSFDFTIYWTCDFIYDETIPCFRIANAVIDDIVTTNQVCDCPDAINSVSLVLFENNGHCFD